MRPLIRTLALAGLASLAFASAAQAAGKQSGDAMPLTPIIRDEVVGNVHFALNVNAACKALGPIADPPGGGLPYLVAGCVQAGVIVLPHPCIMAKVDRLDGYARLVCHELQHYAGWPGDHPLVWTAGPKPGSPEYWRAYWQKTFAEADASLPQ